MTVRGAQSSSSELQLCAAQFLVHPLLGGAASGGEGEVRWPLQFSFSSCAGSHSFCEPIHSEDTNLFQTMKNQNSVLTVSSCSAIPTRLEIEQRLAQLCQNHSCQAFSRPQTANTARARKRTQPHVAESAAACSQLHKSAQKKFCQTSAELRQTLAHPMGEGSRALGGEGERDRRQK